MRHHQSLVRNEAQTARAVNRAWIVCAALAVGTHALLLFAIRPGTPAQPGVLADEPSAVEVSIVESASPTPPAAEPLPAPPPPLPPPPEPMPEPVPEAVPEPTPVPAVTRPTPSPARPRSDVPQTRVAASPRTATPSSGTVSSRGPTTSARPRYRSNPKPAYPPESRRAGQQGVVVIAVEVTSDGRAASVQLSRSSGFPLLDTAALQAVRRWTFEPARTGGIPTASRVEVPVRFDLAR